MALKFSIITPSLNQGRFIRDTIESVLDQNYDNFEHIIIDGKSTDNTLDIIKKYPHIKWVSKKDKGPADAINSGFELATGDIFCWLNSDDYYDSNIFYGIDNIFESNPDIGLIIGNLTIVDETAKIILKDKTYPYSKDYLIRVSADVIRQPCTFFRKELFMKTKGLNINLKFAFDYDLFIRMLGLSKALFTDINYAYYREHDNTLTRLNLRKQALEIKKISSGYGSNITDPIFKTFLKKNIFPWKFGFNRLKR